MAEQDNTPIGASRAETRPGAECDAPANAPAAPLAQFTLAGKLTHRTAFHPIGYEQGGDDRLFEVAGGHAAEKAVGVASYCLRTSRGLLKTVLASGETDVSLVAAVEILNELAIASYRAAGVEV